MYDSSCIVFEWRENDNSSDNNNNNNYYTNNKLVRPSMIARGWSSGALLIGDIEDLCAPTAIAPVGTPLKGGLPSAPELLSNTLSIFLPILLLTRLLVDTIGGVGHIRRGPNSHDALPPAPAAPPRSFFLFFHPPTTLGDLLESHTAGAVPPAGCAARQDEVLA